ncbi:unnamed protein product [Choristocarpus tenellus]
MSSDDHTTITSLELEAKELANALKFSGVKVAAFDMDQCLVAQHSRGRMTHQNLPKFLAKVTPDFLIAVPILIEEGLNVAVATHSDRAEYNWLQGRTPRTHLLGEDLVWAVLNACFPHRAASFFVVAYNPRARSWFPREENRGKRLHVRLIAEHYGVDASEVILFDDDQDNVSLSQGFRAVKVNPAVGFRISDLMPL